MANEKRLIDAMDTVTKISKRVTPLIGQGCHQQRVYSEVLKCIAEAPTVDAVEVVHGRWIPNFEYDFDRGEHRLAGYHCDKCGIWTLHKSNYCPNCGADMRERKDNG